MICNKCNKQISNNSKFCIYCGNNISSYNSSQNFNDENTRLNDSIYTNNKEDKVKNNLENNNKTTNNPQNNNTPQDSKQGLKVLSILLGVVGILVMFFHFAISSIIFVIGIIVGVVYKSKTRNKCLGLTLNIVGLILNIILFFISVFLLSNTLNEVKERAECSNQGGYWGNGKCIKNEDKVDSGLNFNEQQNNSSNTSVDNKIDQNKPQVGFWACKDNDNDVSMSIGQIDDIDESEYKIGITFEDTQKYIISYSSSKREKGVYTMLLTKTDDYAKYYHLEMIIEEIYDSGNTSITDVVVKSFDFIIDISYQRMFIISKDGSVNYSCYRD